MKCSKCKKKATHDIPKAFCAFHWAKWWTYGYLAILIRKYGRKRGREEYEKEFAEVLKMATR